MNFIALWMWSPGSPPNRSSSSFRSTCLSCLPMNWNREMEFFKNCLTAGSSRAVAAAAGRISQPHVSLPQDCLTSWSGALIMKMIIIMIISQCFINLRTVVIIGNHLQLGKVIGLLQPLILSHQLAPWKVEELKYVSLGQKNTSWSKKSGRKSVTGMQVTSMPWREVAKSYQLDYAGLQNPGSNANTNTNTNSKILTLMPTQIQTQIQKSWL